MVKKPKVSRPSADHYTAARAVDEAPEDLLPGALRQAKPGALLIRRILEEGNRRGLAKDDLAQQSLGIVRSYFADLCNGKKDIPNLGDDAIEQAARFLGIAPVEAMRLAGQLSDADFYAGQETYHDALLHALRYMFEDKEYPLTLPVELFEATRNVQSHAVQAYERITGKKLIPGKLTNDDVIRRHRAASTQELQRHDTSTGVDVFDRVLRACRNNHDITLRSARLRNGTFVDALGLAIHGSSWNPETGPAALDIDKAVATFAAEIKLLDSVDPKPDLFRTGVVAAALLALSLDPSTLDFFRRLSQARAKDAGPGQPNPFRKILSLVTRKAKAGAESTNTLQEQELCAVTLEAVEISHRHDHGSGARALSNKAMSGLLNRTVQRVLAQKAEQSSNTR